MCALPATLTVLRASSTSCTLDERPCLRSSCNAHCLARFKHLMYSRRETMPALFLQRSLSCALQAPHVLLTRDHACALPATLSVLRASGTCTLDERSCLRSSCNAQCLERFKHLICSRRETMPALVLQRSLSCALQAPHLLSTRDHASSCNAHCLARFKQLICSRRETMPALFLRRSLSCALQAPHVLSKRDLQRSLSCASSTSCALDERPCLRSACDAHCLARFKHLMYSPRETTPALFLQRSLSCALQAPHVLSTRDHACALPATLTVLRASSTSCALDERPCLSSSCNAHCLASFKHLKYSRRETMPALFLQRSLSCALQAPHVLSTRDHACALPATLTVLRASSTSCTLDERPCLRSSCNAHCLARFRHLMYS